MTKLLHTRYVAIYMTFIKTQLYSCLHSRQIKLNVMSNDIIPFYQHRIFHSNLLYYFLHTRVVSLVHWMKTVYHSLFCPDRMRKTISKKQNNFVFFPAEFLDFRKIVFLFVCFWYWWRGRYDRIAGNLLLFIRVELYWVATGQSYIVGMCCN